MIAWNLLSSRWQWQWQCYDWFFSHFRKLEILFKHVFSIKQREKMIRTFMFLLSLANGRFFFSLSETSFPLSLFFFGFRTPLTNGVPIVSIVVGIFHFLVSESMMMFQGNQIVEGPFLTQLHQTSDSTFLNMAGEEDILICSSQSSRKLKPADQSDH